MNWAVLTAVHVNLHVLKNALQEINYKEGTKL